MRRFAFLMVIGMLATMAALPTAHASDPAHIVCVAHGGTGYFGPGDTNFTIEGGPVGGFRLGCASVSGTARPDQAPNWIGITPPMGDVYLHSPPGFSCGNGTMTLGGRIYLSLPDGEGYDTSYQPATFVAGQADVTGTGSSVFYGHTTVSVSGTIRIDDGDALNMCDDTFPNARVIIDLTLS